MSGLEAPTIWFWQTEVSPHMTALAVALALKGCDVTYVAEQLVSSNRARQGWVQPHLGAVHLELAPTSGAAERLVKAVSTHSIHICQGLRSNGLVSKAQRALAKRGLRQWVVMETVEDFGWLGVLKGITYRWLFFRWRKNLQGVLATGYRTAGWVAKRGMPALRVFPFAYFLPAVRSVKPGSSAHTASFRFVFVGRFIELKRLDLLHAALAKLQRRDVELMVIGSGPLESELRIKLETTLADSLIWVGRLPMDEVTKHLAQADCLVLPSRNDGWGAVVSEALMVGTPVICSDPCGAAGVVRASGYGGVFHSGDVDDLVTNLQRAISYGRLPLEERLRLREWARCLGAEEGARYLLQILDYTAGKGERPTAPWDEAKCVV